MTIADPVATPERLAIEEQREAFVGRLAEALTGMFEIAAVHLGDRLGYYTALAANGALTSTELAEQTGTNERYVREWLEQQATAGVLEVDDPAKAPRERRFSLPAAHAEPLIDRDSIWYWAPLARLGVSTLRPIDAVLEAFRSGGGVPYRAYGAEFAESLADATRPWYLHMLGDVCLPAVPDVHARLQSDPPARVADVGAGAAWSSIAIARAYPNVQIDVIDLDPTSIDLAKRNIAGAGLSDRIRAEVRDAADPGLAGQYDLVLACACVHDMSDPIAALRSMRRLAGDTGAVLVIGDPKPADTFLGNEDMQAQERLHYGFSVFHCLPVGMVDQPSAATGTMMRPATIRDYARQAGFRDAEVVTIDDAWNSFFRLVN
jgi:SAM-dependent methyltransferase